MQLLKVVNNARTDSVGRQQRAAATALGHPLWRECFDKYQLRPMPSYYNARVAIESLGIECRYDEFHDKMLIGYRGDVKLEVQTLMGEFSDNTLVQLREISLRGRWPHGGPQTGTHA